MPRGYWEQPLPEYGAKPEANTEQLTVYVSMRAKRCLQALADSEDIPVAAYVRRLLDEHFATMPEYLNAAIDTHVATLAAAVSAINAGIRRPSNR